MPLPPHLNYLSRLDQSLTVHSVTSVAIRLEASRLVSHNRIDDAKYLVDQGIVRYGLSEDLLSMSALIAQLQMDWPKASAAYEALTQLQYPNVPTTVLLNWVRVLVCMGDKPKAIATLRSAACSTPEYAALAKEAESLGLDLDALIMRAA